MTGTGTSIMSTMMNRIANSNSTVADGDFHTAAEEQEAFPKKYPYPSAMFTTVTLLISILVTSFILTLPFSSVAVMANKKHTKQPSRHVFIDNLKFLCVVGVILGHFVDYNVDQVEYESWLSGAGNLFHAYSRLAPWTINMLVFASGVVSRKPATNDRFRSLLLNLIVPTLLWEFLVKPCILPIFAKPSLSVVIESISKLVSGNAYSREWYLEALIIWRLLSFLFQDMKQHVAMIVSLGVSALGGYYSFGVMSMDEAVGFLPFFVAGLVMPCERWVELVPCNRTNKLFGVMFILLISTLEFCIESNLGPLPDNHGTYNWFWAQSEYVAAKEAANDGFHIPLATYGFRRLAKQEIGLLQGLALLLTLVPQTRTLYSDVGRYALYPFLLHETVLRWDNQILQLLPMTMFTSTPMHLVVFMIKGFWLVFASILLSSKSVRSVLGPLLTPRFWLEPLLFPAHTNNKKLKHHASDVFPGNDKQVYEGHESNCIERMFEGFPNCNDSYDLFVGQEGRHKAAAAAAALPTKRKGPLSTLAPFASAASWGRKLDHLLHPEFTKGRNSLYWQSQATHYLPCLIYIPLAVVAGMAMVAYVWFPILQEYGVFQQMEAGFVQSFHQPVALFLIVMSLLKVVVTDLAGEVWAFIMLRRGLRRVPLPQELSTSQGLVHVVVICQYKEPLDVLDATIQSLAENTMAYKTMIVLASEARDDTAQTKFKFLLTKYGSSFRHFMQTLHPLTEGEIVGKSSNENYAVRKLYEYIQTNNDDPSGDRLDPFQVMLTICDADSLFDTVFLEQVEGEYWRTAPDASRVIYDSPINTYRNLGECDWLTQMFEITRCQNATFTGVLAGDSHSFRPAQSNYSLTLGFAHEINYWDPSNTSEDYHTTLKAKALTGSGNNVVVRVWSLILNDSVVGFKDRWTQAKRHMWGIEEVAWVLQQFTVLRLGRWMSLFIPTCRQMLTSALIVPRWIIFLFPPMWQIISSLNPSTVRLILVWYAGSILYHWTKVLVREWYLHRFILAHRQHMMPRSLGLWIRLVAAYPLIQGVADFIYNTIATWTCLLHARQHATLTYVTAPKSFTTAITTTKEERSQ